MHGGGGYCGARLFHGEGSSNWPGIDRQPWASGVRRLHVRCMIRTLHGIVTQATKARL
jgi:hypothetical protein